MPLGYETDVTSPGGGVARHLVQTLAAGGTHRTNVSEAGGISATDTSLGDLITTTSEDLSTSSIQLAGDPRFGMLAPYAGSKTWSTPLGVTSTTAVSRSASTQTATPLLLENQTTATTITGTSIPANMTFSDYFDASLGTDVLTTHSGRTTTKTIDAMGRVKKIASSGIIAPVSFAYDPSYADRIVSMTVGDGVNEPQRVWQVLPYATDNGFPGQYIDPIGHITNVTNRDLVGRVTSILLPDDSATVQETYDVDGNPTSLTTPDGYLHLFPAYTSLDQLQTYTPPVVPNDAMPATQYGCYDSDRNLQTVAGPDGTVTLTYEPTKRRLQSISQPIATINYGRVDATSRVTTLSTTDGTEVDYVYDGPLATSATWAHGIPTAPVVHAAYDGLGRVIERDAKLSTTVAWSYDADGLLAGAGLETLSRNPSCMGGVSGQTGLLAGVTLDSDIDAYCYSLYGEVNQYTATAPNFSYSLSVPTRDALGRIVEKVESVTINGVAQPTTTRFYNYDDLGRLWQVCTDGTVCGNVIATYTYFADGNRNAVVGGNGAIVVDAQDRMTEYGGTYYTYSPGGNLASKSGAQTATYTYDLLGNLRSATVGGNATITYGIDGANRRISRSVTSGSTTTAQYFVYQDGLRPIAELGTSGAVVSTFVYGTKPNVPDYMVRGGRRYHLVTDQVGSVRYVVDTQSGVVMQTITYDEFGNAVDAANPTPSANPTYVPFQPFGFAGGIWDQTTGLVRFGSRDYDAQTGRWATKDAIGFEGGLNLYRYCSNDPINCIDPSGYLAGVPDWLLALDDSGALYGAQNFSAGVVSGITGGLSDIAFGALGVDNCTSSTAFRVGWVGDGAGDCGAWGRRCRKRRSRRTRHASARRAYYF